MPKQTRQFASRRIRNGISFRVRVSLRLGQRLFSTEQIADLSLSSILRPAVTFLNCTSTYLCSGRP